MKRKTALTIAGSDCSGGAGIQADLKTMAMNGVYGMSVITALTAQNTIGVTDISEVSVELLKAQLDAVFTDIPPDAVKIGMISSRELVEIIGDSLRNHQAKQIVIDPVMVSTSGSQLMKADAIDALKKHLFPLASVITPNIPEAEILAGRRIHSKQDMLFAAEKLSQAYGCAVLLKGGHRLEGADDLLEADDLLGADDLLYVQEGARWFRGKRISNPNTHGTGCTLSSAIAANLAKGYDLEEAVGRAKDYLSGALEAMLDLGRGSGPLDHGFAWKSEFAK